MNDLIGALLIFAIYDKSDYTTGCEHDVFYVYVNPNVVLQEVLPVSTDMVIGSSDEQRAKMFESFAQYFSEVQNPENTTTNTFFKAKYAPLNEVLNTIRPIMGKYGLAITQTTGVDSGECFVSTLLTHNGGGYIYYPALKGKPTKTDIQGIGAVLTYLRRFALNAVAGVAGEVDDDGKSASTPKQPKKPKPPERREIDDVFMLKGSTYIEAVQKLFELVEMKYSFGEAKVKTKHQYKYPKEVVCKSKDTIYTYFKSRKISEATIDLLDIREDEKGMLFLIFMIQTMFLQWLNTNLLIN